MYVTMTDWYVTSHPGQLSLAILPWVGAMSTSQGAVTPCSWGVKAGMVHVWIAYIKIPSKAKQKESSHYRPHGPIGTVLISVSIAISQTPAYAARPRIQGQCIARRACLLPSFRR